MEHTLKSQPLEKINSDILGKNGLSFLKNREYFVVFLDDSTAMSILYFLKE